MITWLLVDLGPISLINTLTLLSFRAPYYLNQEGEFYNWPKASHTALYLYISVSAHQLHSTLQKHFAYLPPSRAQTTGLPVSWGGHIVSNTIKLVPKDYPIPTPSLTDTCAHYQLVLCYLKPTSDNLRNPLFILSGAEQLLICPIPQLLLKNNIFLHLAPSRYQISNACNSQASGSTQRAVSDPKTSHGTFTALKNLPLPIYPSSPKSPSSLMGISATFQHSRTFPTLPFNKNQEASMPHSAPSFSRQGQTSENTAVTLPTKETDPLQGKGLEKKSSKAKDKRRQWEKAILKHW